MLENIFEKLKQVIKNSKSKYYHFPVAAILECTDNTYYQGVNIETSSPGAGTCAERCALFFSLADGKTYLLKDLCNESFDEDSLKWKVVMLAL